MSSMISWTLDGIQRWQSMGTSSGAPSLALALCFGTILHAKLYMLIFSSLESALLVGDGHQWSRVEPGNWCRSSAMLQIPPPCSSPWEQTSPCLISEMKSRSPWAGRTHGCYTDDNGRTGNRTMAAGSSVTWTHSSVRYEVTWG
jgi:hypothetical protein